MEKNLVVELLSSVDFWIKLLVTCAGAFAVYIFKQVRADIERLYSKSRHTDEIVGELKNELERHAGWHNGKREGEKD